MAGKGLDQDSAADGGRLHEYSNNNSHDPSTVLHLTADVASFIIISELSGPETESG